MNPKNHQLNYKKFVRNSWNITLVGILVFGYGAVKYFFFQPHVAVNLSKLQPTISDGSIALILGLVLLGAGSYRVLNSEKSFKDRMDIDKMEEDKWKKE